MNLQVNRSSIGKAFLQLASLSLLGLCAANASAQLPGKDEGSAPAGGKSVPIITKAVSAPGNTDPIVALRSAKLIYVSSSSLLVGVSVIEAKLQKRAEFSQMGLVITRELEAADLILEVQHDVLTKYVYTAIDRRTNMVLASGKLSSLGGTVAGKVAKRFLKQLLQARATAVLADGAGAGIQPEV